MKTAWLFFKRVLLAILLFLVLYVAFSFLLSYLPTGGKERAGVKDKTIYLFSNGVHLDIVVPVELIPDNLRRQILHNPDAKLLGIGWGDKGFYLDTPTWAELRASVAVKAMFLPSPTAMHVTEHQTVKSNWSKTTISAEQLTDLFTYIEATFEMDAEGKVQELVGEGYTPRDRFYEAHGNYSCFKTCNTWVNTAMKKAGVKTAVWTPMDKGVLRYLEEVN